VTKRAVLLIAIVGVLCFGLLGYVKPVQAASSMIGVAQTTPTDVWVDATVEEDAYHFKTIQAAVNAVATGGTIRVNGGNYGNPITIDKSLTILGVGTDTDAPLINGQIVLASQANPTGLLKLYNLRFGEANGAITIGEISGAVFGEVELNQLTFSTTPVADSRAIQTASSVQIKDLRVLNCVINAAHGIELNGDIGSATISNNIFNLTGQSAGRFDAITIDQNTKAVDSVNATGALTIKGNTLNKPTGEDYPYGSTILNQADFTLTSPADGKKLTASGNTLVAGGTTITDQTLFIQDKIATFVLLNIAPVAQSQTVTTAEDTAIAITLIATDVEGDPLTYGLITNPEFGTLSGTAPNLTYNPPADYYGSVSFTFKVGDGTAYSNVATVTISVTAVNDAPVAQGQTVTTAEDTAATITLITSDVDGDSLTYSIGTATVHGFLSIEGNVVSYTPEANFNGSDSFTFKANDGTVNSNEAMVIITINAINDAPITEGKTVTIAEGTSAAITLAASDVDIDPLTYILVTPPTHGAAEAVENLVIYTPAANYNGPDSFTYKANDGHADSNIATVKIVVTAINDAPVAQSQTVTTAEDTPTTVNLAASDMDGDPLTYSIGTATVHGFLSIEGNVVSYTPEANFNGSDSFTFKANDSTVNSNEAMVSITINAVNDAPITEGKTVTIAEGTSAAITLVASDVDGDPLTYSIITAPSYGSAIIEDNEVAYIPTVGYNGPDSFTFLVSDDKGGSATGTITINVTLVNHAPSLTLVPNGSVDELQRLTFTVMATDRENSPVYYLLQSAPEGASIDMATGVFTWTPSEAQGPHDYSLFVCANDGALTTCQPIMINVNEVNAAPTMMAIAAQPVNEGEQLSFITAATDTDVPAQTLSYSFSGNVPAGMQINVVTGEVTWTPSEAQGGNDYTATVCASDGVVLALTCRDVVVTVLEVNSAPTFTEILAKTVKEGEQLSFTAIATDTDIPAQTLTFSLANAPAGAAIDTATGVITWTPTEDQGPQVYNVGVCVSDGVVEIPICQTVMVTVNEVNVTPALAEIPTKVVNEGELLTFTASGSDGDLPTQTLTFSLADAPAGAAIDTAMGVFTWTPSEAQGGHDFTVTVCVSDGVSTTCQNLTITVEDVNSAPTMAAIAAQSVNEGEQLSFIAAATDTDLPVQTLSYSFSGNVPAGMQINAATGEVTWTPSEAQGGNDYTVTVCASDGAMNVCQVVSITVNKTDSAPQVDAVPEQAAQVGALLTFSVKASDADLPAQTLTYSLQDGPAGAGIDPKTGVFTWAPGVGQGPQDYTLKVCVSDGTLSTCQDVTVRVAGVPTQPLIKLFLPLISR
jgi:hypothetical protein